MGAGKAPISNQLLPSQPPPPPTPNARATSAKFASASTIQLNLNSCWALAESFDPVSQAEKEASAAISRRVTEAVELLEKGGNCRLKVTSMKHCSTSLRWLKITKILRSQNMEGLGEHCLFTRLGTEKKQLQKWKISQYL
ncbi:uncharacterized protein LOC7466744 isoform X2 [Populus trichocarpa]|uniref:uncharacterized protein LOC7466744 isoform X2 n=1 Tax=Populus trichocarpa TaxID=3694 RepID=UPI0022796F58|nr:uncharacterized protein LOC7466744 isoform X2 [Populus trichocarpa]